jgi:hypothetical protein
METLNGPPKLKIITMTNRRNFIKTLGRGLALGSLTGITGYLALRDQPAAGEVCDFDFACKNCKRLSSCTLPEAEVAKEKKGLSKKSNL